MFCSVLIRRLKEGVSFEEFREAWEPEVGHFGSPVRVFQARRTDDEREILSFGLIDISAEELNASLERIAEVIETTVAAGIYEVFTEVDLS